MNAIFVYGTLMRGESLHSLLQAAEPRAILPARTAGVLVHLGEYPGLLPASPGMIVPERTADVLVDPGESPGSLPASPGMIRPERTADVLVGPGESPGSRRARGASLPVASPLLPEGHGEPCVQGEYVEFASLDELLPQLDEVEEYNEQDEAASLYLRRAVEVVLLDGSLKTAWAYLYNGPYDPTCIISGGDWHNRPTSARRQSSQP